MTKENMQTLVNDGFKTLMVFFEKNPSHPSKEKFYSAMMTGDMKICFEIFQSFLVNLEKNTPEGVPVEYILGYWAKK